MTDYYFSIAVDNRRTLCISPLTREEIRSDGERSDPGFGYYLYSMDQAVDGLTILAEVGTADAARELYELLMLRHGGLGPALDGRPRVSAERETSI
jgi:hypothetical protein